MIVTHGGIDGGYGLYLRDGKPTFVYNYLDVERPTVAAKDPLPKGKAKLVVDFAYDGGGMGKGGTVTHDRQRQEGRRGQAANGRSRSSSRSAKGSTSAWTSARRWTSPTSCRSRSPGTIEKVTIDLAPTN